LNAAAEWIASQFESAGLQTSYQDYSLVEQTYRNVIGYRAGSSAGVPAFVIGAHYDAYLDSPGADDNASGVAALLELARTLPMDPPRFDQYFVAFSTEEPPHFGTDEMGSFLFAKKLVEAGEEVSLMVALDTVGYFSDDPNSQNVPAWPLRWLYPRRGNFVAVVADTANGVSIRRVKQAMIAMRELPVHSFRAPARFGTDESDHLSFWKLGLPAVLVTDTAYLRNPHYHAPGDVPETLDYAKMAQVVRMLHGVLWNNGGAPLAAREPS
jgi:Zn-dependent M28 family amino/carboxypeptidase